MIDELSWLGKKEELEFRKLKFRDKNAGKIYQYSNHVDGLIRTNQLHSEFFYERLIFSGMFLISGFLFNTFRIISILLATIPMLIIAASYLLIAQNFNIYKIAYSFAILLFILSGIYYNYKVKTLEKELSQNLLENQLIERDRK